jgi:RND family efflux transporter MFP subunit
VAVENQAALLQQLRIDRSANTAGDGKRSAGRRSLRMGALVVATVAVLIAWRLGMRPSESASTAVPGSVTTPDSVSAHDSASSVAQSLAAHPTLAGTSQATPPALGNSILDATGYVIALREATVSAKNIYRVAEVLVQEGQAVEQGQVIARLDDSNLGTALNQAQAQLKQSEAALAATRLAAADARPRFLRDQQQLAEGLISQGVFETTKAGFDAAQAAADVAEQNLAVSRSNVEAARRLLDDTIIRAPFAGVVTAKGAQPGEILAPQLPGGAGIAKIVDMTSLEVDVDVNEKFINKIHAGQAANVTLNAYPDWQIPAVVIGAIPTADRAKATMKVRIAFGQKDARIVPEMGARVSFLESPDPATDSRGH